MKYEIIKTSARSIKGTYNTTVWLQCISLVKHTHAQHM